MEIDPLKELEDTTKEIDSYLKKHSQNVFSRYPILFSFLVTFGLVSVWFGFESLIQSIPFLAERPLLILFIGVIILLFTGSLYKKLS